jgi:hypothetical protein
VTTSTTIDMVGELTYSRTEQQLKQLALTRAHNLLEYEVIWGHIDILVVSVRRLSRRWKVKTLLAGPSPTSPMKAEITISPISNILTFWLLLLGGYLGGGR